MWSPLSAILTTPIWNDMNLYDSQKSLPTANLPIMIDVWTIKYSSFVKHSHLISRFPKQTTFQHQVE